MAAASAAAIFDRFFDRQLTFCWNRLTVQQRIGSD
jgi:hypothetical protein